LLADDGFEERFELGLDALDFGLDDVELFLFTDLDLELEDRAGFETVDRLFDERFTAFERSLREVALVFFTFVDFVVLRLDVFCLTAADRLEPDVLAGVATVLRFVAVLDVETAEERLDAVRDVETPSSRLDVAVLAVAPRTLDVRAAVLLTELLRASVVPSFVPDTRAPDAMVPALTERGRITDVPLRSKVRRFISR
jgi:hypothetical protein